jgi:hypothetical protein
MKKAVFVAFLFIFLLNLEVFSLIEETPFVFEQPLLITSAGQSAEVQLASVLAKRAGLTYTLSKVATSKDLENIKTLVLVLGTSLKGLGAAGLDTAKEKARVLLLLKEAQKKNIPLLCLHLGGESRRGQLTDEMIKDFLPFAKMAIVVKSGNKDGIFSKICKEKNIPLIEVEKTVDALEPLKQAFKTGSSANPA